MKVQLIPGKLWVPGKIIEAIPFFLFDKPVVSCKPLVFFRISIGLLVLMHFLAIWPDLQVLFGSRSIMPQEVMALYADSLVISNTTLQSYLPVTVTAFYTIFSSLYVLFALCIITGTFTRYAALLLLLLNVSLMSHNVFFMYGIDYFTRMSLFYLIIFPSGDRFSVAALVNKKPAPVNYLIYLRFLQFHLTAVYLFSGIDKVMGYNWRNGEAIWKAVNLPHVNNDYNIDFSWMAGYPFIPFLLGWAVVLTELLYPLIWIKKLRNMMLLAVTGMHLSIAMIFNLYFFSSVMIIWNLAAFYDFDKQRNTVNP